MSQVFVTTYKVTPTYQSIADAHYAEIDRVRDVHIAVMKEFNAVAYRQNHARGLNSLFFPADQVPPPGFRQTIDKQMHAGIMVQEAVPAKSTKIGKELHKRFQEIERMPSDFELAKAFGWMHQHQYDEHRRYFPTAQRLMLPHVRYFIRLPRTVDDGWGGHFGLVAIPEDAYMMELEAHNKLAREARDH